MRTRFIIGVTLALLVLAESTVFAQSVEQVAQRWFSSDEAAGLAAAGGTYAGVLTLERLPSGAYLGEIGVAVGTQTARYPLKFERAGASWSVVWSPTPSYGAALLGLAKSGYLPEAHAQGDWAKVARLPAFPVVAVRARYVTPFGEVSPNDASDQPPQGDLEWSPLLLDHTRRWIREVLDEDPAPAGIDLVLAGNLDWKAANKIVLNLSASGLYQIWFVTRGEQLGVVTAQAPVTPAAANAPAVAVYPMEDGRFGVRVSSEGPSERCSEAFALCIETAAELPERLERWLQPGGSHATFGAVGAMEVGAAVAMLAAFADYMGLESHRVVVGYVQR